MSKLDIKPTEKKKANFKVGDIEQDLQRLLGKKYLNSVFELDDKLAMSATSCLIDGLEYVVLRSLRLTSCSLLGDEENHGAFNLRRYDLNQYMRYGLFLLFTPSQIIRLDSAAIQALNVLPNPREPNQTQNLFGLLNKVWFRWNCGLILV